jgi:hypothetical protein
MHNVTLRGSVIQDAAQNSVIHPKLLAYGCQQLPEVMEHELRCASPLGHRCDMACTHTAKDLTVRLDRRAQRLQKRRKFGGYG